MVPRRRAQPRLEPLALPLPAGGVPVRRPDRRERPAGQARPRVRAARHRRLRRGPLLDRRGRLRQGRPDRPADDRAGHQRRARTPRRCTCCRRRGSATRGRWDVDAAEAAAAGRAPTAPSPSTTRSSASCELLAGARPGRHARRPLLFCENETNDARLYGSATEPAVPEGRHQRPRRRRARATVNPDAARHQGGAAGTRSTVAPGATVELRLRLRPAGSKPAEAADALGDRLRRRRRAAPAGGRRVLRRADAGRRHGRRGAMVMRQAFAGMLWSKQLYAYDVARWLDGDPTQPPPPAARLTGRNARWRNFDAFDIMSMPDKWEYPWFAAWDLAFHCVALAHVDPAFAKYQLILLCREWFQHPNGALPAYEWDFGDVNPPVQAWAALEVFAIDGGRDLDFLSRVFDKLLVNFTWWVNREDANGTNLFEGGFLGLDNIGPLDRSHLPVGGTLEQSDATGWMAFYALAMAAIAAILHRSGAAAGDRPRAQVPRALRRHPPRPWTTLGRVGRRGRPVLRQAGDARRHRGAGEGAVDGRASSRCWPRSSLDEDVARPGRDAGQGRSPGCSTRGLGGREGLVEQGLAAGRARRRAAAARRRRRRPAAAAVRASCSTRTSSCRPTASGPCRPTTATIPTSSTSRASRRPIDYEPAESTTNDVRRQLELAGPDLVPAQLPRRQRPRALLPLLRRRARRSSTRPAAGSRCTLDEIADDLRQRLDRCSCVGPDGRRPCFGGVERLQRDPAWQDNLVVQRVLPRRQRRRARRVAPDGLDRRRRRPHPRPAGQRRLRRSARLARLARASRPRLVSVGSSADRRCACARAGASRSARRRREQGTNFAVASSVADGIVLCLFDDDGARDPGRRWSDYDAGVWHGFVPGVGPGQAYGYRAAGPYDPARGVRCNPAKLLLDPYARATTGAVTFGPEVLGYDLDDPDRPSTLDSAGHVPAQPGRRPGLRLDRRRPPPAAATPTRSSTRCTSRASRCATPTCPPELRGTYAGLGHEAAIAHLVDLGVTAVELLPVHQNVPEAFLVAAGPDQLLGLQHDRLLRPPRRLLGRGPRRAARRAGRRVQGDGRRPARRRARGRARRRVQPHRRGRPHRARRCATAASTTPPTTGSTRTTPAATSTRPAAATPSTPATRSACS